MKKHLRTYLFFIILIITANQVIAQKPASIVEVKTYGSFETGGVDIQVDNLNGNESAKLYYKNANEDNFQEGHTFVKYDANHFATSLFNLSLDTEYFVKVELVDPDGKNENQIIESKLKTRKEFNIPEPLETVIVSNNDELKKAIKNASPGLEIKIKSGDYPERVVIDSLLGTEKLPIVLTAYDTSNHPHFYDGILINKSSYIILSNLEIEKNKTKAVGGVRILGSNHITVTDCYVHDSGENYSANIIIAFSDQNIGEDKNGYHLIQNNIISDETPMQDEFIFTYKKIEGVTYHGIRLDDVPGGFNTLRNNKIYGVMDGISCGGDEKEEPYITIDDKDILKIHLQQNIDVYNNVIYNVHDDGIETDGHMVNGRIFNNRIGKSTNGISTASVYPGPIFILRNYIHGFEEGACKMNTRGIEITRNVFWYHNTIKQHETARFCILRGSPGLTTDITYRNNIIYALSSPIDTRVSDENTSHTNHSFDYNLLYSEGEKLLFAWGEEVGSRKEYDTFEDFKEGTRKDFNNPQEVNGIFKKPKLDLSKYNDYEKETRLLNLKLLKGSPGIDEALIIPGINDNYKGAAPDMGAYEVE